MMKNIALFFVLVALFGACGKTAKEETTTVEAPAWQQLFNGKDLNDWHPKITGYALDDNFANTFRVQDSVLKVSYDGYDEFHEKYGHLFYKDKFANYILHLEYRFTGEQVKGGPGWAFRNSGAMLHGQDPTTMTKDQDFPISIEVQLLGGNDAGERTTANLCTPGTNVVMDGKLITDHCVSSHSKTYNGDQWVSLKILVLGDSVIKHVMEGEVVLMYEQPQIGGGNVLNADSTVKKDGTLLKEGFISLQSESHPVEYRKVDLLDLTPYLQDRKALEAVLTRELALKGN